MQIMLSTIIEQLLNNNASSLLAMELSEKN